MLTPTLARISQRDQAYASLREVLILQQIPEGTRLSDPAWAQQLGVSRTAVREALARLEAERLIERAPTAGYIVPVLTEEDVREILEVRLALESAAIDSAIEHACNKANHLAPLIEAIDQQEALIRQEYRLGANEADRRFHHRLVELAGNHRLIDMYHRAPLPIIHRLVSPRNISDRRIVQEHRDIIDAVAQGDAQRARAHLRTHLRWALPDAMRISERGQDAAPSRA